MNRIGPAAVALVWVSVSVAATDAEKLLVARGAEFEQAVIEVTDGVYTAVGFGVSTTSMIVGDDGVVIVDTQVDEPAARGVLAAFRQITDKPVKAIVLTHGHGDHTGGIGVFAGAGDPEIWARQGYGEERRWLEEAGLQVHRARGVRQAGFHAHAPRAREQRRCPGLLAPAGRCGFRRPGAADSFLFGEPEDT